MLVTGSMVPSACTLTVFTPEYGPRSHAGHESTRGAERPPKYQRVTPVGSPATRRALADGRFTPRLS